MIETSLAVLKQLKMDEPKIQNFFAKFDNSRYFKQLPQAQ